ncbi:MAG TPA: DUF924 family protein [Gammaproteobacteria bacterium]
MDDAIARLLDYWFGPESETEEALNRRFERWFRPDSATDAEVAQRFGVLAERAARGDLDDWAATARGRLALILLLDQLPRQLHRGSAAAFASDEKAFRLAIDGVESGMDLELGPLRRAFFYMPLQHAEDLVAQELSVRKFRALCELPGTPDHVQRKLESFAEYAKLHRDIVARFGRFPHRNRSLGRGDTPEEREFLDAGGPSFGQ